MKKIKMQVVDCYEKFFSRFQKILESYYEVEYSEQPDFLFYSVYDTGREHYKYKNCVKIFIGAEGVVPDFNECDYAIGSYPMNIGERYLQLPYQGIPAETLDREKFRNIKPADRCFCNFIYSNASNGKGAVLRQDFCKKLMQYKHVDCPGAVMNNMKDAIGPRNGNWYKDKLIFLKNYKFTIAFENVSMPGMITEKLIQAFQAGTIPIYWGDPAVSNIFNREAFVNCHDYDSWDAVIEKIKEIDNNDEEYMKMILTRPVLPGHKIDYDEDIIGFFKKIIEKGNEPYEKDPLGWDAGSLSALWIENMQNNFFYRLLLLQQKGKNGLKRIYDKFF